MGRQKCCRQPAWHHIDEQGWRTRRCRILLEWDWLVSPAKAALFCPSSAWTRAVSDQRSRRNQKSETCKRKGMDRLDLILTKYTGDGILTTCSPPNSQASTHNVHTGRCNAAEVSLGSTVDVVNDNHIIRRLEQVKYCCSGGTSRSVRRAMLGAFCLCHCSLKSSGFPLLVMEGIESLVMRIASHSNAIIETTTHM